MTEDYIGRLIIHVTPSVEFSLDWAAVLIRLNSPH